MFSLSSLPRVDFQLQRKASPAAENKPQPPSPAAATTPCTHGVTHALGKIDTKADLVTNTPVIMAGRASTSAGNAAGRYNLRPRGRRDLQQGSLRGAAALADSPLLGRLLGEWSHVFDAEVMPLLDPSARALLGRVGQACRDAVLPSPKLPCAGRTVGVPLLVENFLGSVELLAWAKENECLWEAKVCTLAAWGGQLEVLQWAREHHCPWQPDTCSFAAEEGHLEVLRWAREHGCEWDTDTCTYAALRGHLEVLQWAREHHCEWDVATCNAAAQSGHLEVLRWAREHHCPWDWVTTSHAALFGHLEVLKWALERGCPWSSSVLCAAAARGGQLEVLRWLREHDYPWDAGSCAYAAEGGHLETLKWLREHECPWDADTVERATATGHDDVLQWALGNGCPS